MSLDSAPAPGIRLIALLVVNSLCCEDVRVVLLHWSQNSETPLIPFVVVVVDIVFNHCYEFFSAVETFAVISLTFEYSPKALHWAIVDTLAYS